MELISRQLEVLRSFTSTKFRLGGNLPSEAYSATDAIVINSTETVGSKTEVNYFETKAGMSTHGIINIRPL